MENSEAPGVANAHEIGESKGVAAVVAGSGLPWWVIGDGPRRKMAGPYRLQETAQAVRDFAANLRAYELFTLTVEEHPDDGSFWLPDVPNTPVRDAAQPRSL